VILLHMLTRAREDWHAVATRLNEAGLHALAIDFRSHGSSTTGPVIADQGPDWSRLVLDVQAARAFLTARPDQVRTTAIGIAGASVGANAAILEANGVRVLRPRDIGEGLTQLRREGIESVLCEGGGALGAKLLADGLVDRLYWVQAPVWLGDAGVPAFPGVPAHPLSEAPRWIPVARQALGPDTLLVLDRRLCLPVS